MRRSAPVHRLCACCSRRLSRCPGRPRLISSTSLPYFTSHLRAEATLGDYACNSCHSRYNPSCNSADRRLDQLISTTQQSSPVAEFNDNVDDTEQKDDMEHVADDSFALPSNFTSFIPAQQELALSPHPADQSETASAGNAKQSIPNRALSEDTQASSIPCQAQPGSTSPSATAASDGQPHDTAGTHTSSRSK